MGSVQKFFAVWLFIPALLASTFGFVGVLAYGLGFARNPEIIIENGLVVSAVICVSGIVVMFTVFKTLWK